MTIAVPLEARPRPLERVAAWPSVVFPAAMALALVHMLDDAFVHTPRGTSFVSNVATIAVPAAVAVAAAVGQRRLRPGMRAWLAFVLGSVAVIDGALHVDHVRRLGEVAGSDATGIVSGVAGIALVLTGLALALRPKAPRSRARRWTLRLAAVVGVGLTVFYVVMPVAVGVYFVHKQPVPLPTTAWSVPHRDVTLHTSDGLDLAAWFAPSRNGATVVVVHGSGGSRGGTESRATMLARHGYGVLLYDARGSGASDGRPEAVGWTWHRDLEAAVDCLRTRGVANIGVLGVSTGAEVALETAGREPRIRAVVADGAEARTATELRLLPHTPSNLLAAAYTLEMFTVHHVLSHTASPPSLAKQVTKLGRRPILLISSGKGYEHDLTRAYYRRATGPKQLWELTDTQHTQGLAKHPVAYERRVVGFFDRALVRSESR